MQSGNDEAVVSLVIDASGLRQGSIEAIALGKKLTDSLKAIETAANQASGSVSASGAKFVESITSTTRFLDQVERKLNPLADAAKKAEVEMNRLIGIMGGSNVEAAQRASVALELQAKKVLDLKNAIVLASVENKKLETTYQSLERTFQNAIGSLGSLIAKYQPASASAKQMASELASLNASYKAGLIIEENYIAMNSRIINSYNEGAVAAQRLLESRAKMIAQARQDQNVNNSQDRWNLQSGVVGNKAGPDFSRDLRLQMERDNEILNFEKQIDNEILNSRKQRLVQEVAARKSATDLMINDLKRYQTAQASADQDRFKFQEQIAPRSSVAQHTQDVVKQQQDVAKAAKDAADRLDNLTAKFSQDAVAAANYKKTISELNEVFNKGRIGHQELSVETSKAIDTYNKSTVAGQKAAAANKGLSSSIHEVGLNSRVAQYAMTNFSFQINDVVSGLAMGQQPFRIFAQQAGQFVQIFQQIGAVNIGQFFKDMGNNIVSVGGTIGRWLITSVGAAVVGLTALAAGFTLVISRAVAIEGQIRSLGVTLRTLGTDSLVSAKTISNMVPQLQAVGLSRSESIESLQGITRTQGINPQAAVQIARVGANFAAAFGGTASEAAKSFANALAGGVQKAMEFALSIDALTGKEASNLIKMGELGKGMEAVAQIADRVDQRLKGNLLATLGPFDTAILKLKNSWDALLDTLAKSTAIQFLLDKITKLIEGIDKLFQLKPPLWLLNAMSGNIGGAVGAAVGAGVGSAITSSTPVTTATIPALDPKLTALHAASTANAQISQLNNEFAKRLDAWLNALSEADRNLIKITSGFATGGHAPDSNHYRGTAVDIKGLSATARASMNTFGIGVGVQHPGHAHVEPSEIGTATTTLAATRAAQSRAFVQANAGTAQSIINPNDIEKTNKVLEEQERQLRKNLDAQRQFGMSSDLVIAQQKAEKDALDQKMNPAQRERALTLERAAVLGKYAAELNNTNIIQDAATRGTMLQAEATKSGNAAGMQAQAIVQATNEVLTKYGTTIGHNAEISERARQITTKSFADAALGAQQVVATMDPEIAAYERLAVATGKGTAEGRKMELQNQAIANTQNLVNAANARGGDESKKIADLIIQENLAKLKKIDLFKIEADLNRANTQSGNEVQIMQLQMGLQGQTTQEISRQVALLNEKIKLEALGLTSASEEYNKRLAIVDAVERQKIALDDAHRAWQRIEDGVRSLASTIESTLTRSIEDAFNGNKVKSWSETIRSALSSILSQIVSFSFIKPAIGTALGALGFSNLSQQFGTFGSSGLGSLFGGSGTSANGSVNLTATPDGKCAFSLSSVGSGVGIIKDTSSLFGLDLFGNSSSGGGFLSSIFGTSAPNLTGIGTFFGDAAAATNAGFVFPGAGSTTASMGVAESGGFLSGLFGGGSSGAFGGGAALSASGGAELLGGASGIFGGALSGVGSVLSTALPIVGIGLGIAGLLGFNPLDMIFGKSKPSNSAGAYVDLAGGGISGFDEEGNGSNNSAANQFIKSISDFSKNIQKLSGGTLSGGLNPQVFTNQAGQTVYKTSYMDVGEFGTGTIQSQDAQEHLKTITLALARSLEGITATMKQVISTIEDPQLLEAGIQFAAVYDKLGDPIVSTTKVIGPFETALKEIETRFSEIRDTAAGYGLGLEVVDDALRRTKSLLISDFYKSISDAILAINDPVKAIIAEEKKLGQQRVDEAVAIGASVTRVNELNALRLDKIWENQTQSLEQLADSLRTGSLSGMTIGGQLSAANDNFRHTLSLVKGGNLGEMGNLAAQGQGAFTLSQQAYGNAPQTARLRNEIISSIDNLLTNRSFADGTDSTPSGWIRVGENGPEWMLQSGGNKVLSSGQNPFGFGEMVSEIKMLRNEVQMLREENTRVMVGVGQDTGERLEKVRGELKKKPLIEIKRARV